MARFQDVLLAYVIIGIVMFGGGGVRWENAGPIQEVAQFNGDQVTGDSTMFTELQNAQSSVTGIVALASGFILLGMDLIGAFFGFIHWPFIALYTNNAPPILTLFLGGPLIMAFYVSVAGFFIR